MAEKRRVEDKDSGAALRRRAEEQARLGAGQLPENMTELPLEQARRLLHELRVHQIELEMQNEELQRVQAELEDSQARYFDLYDLAPVGYFSLSEKGLILDANLTMAGLLGVERRSLVRQALSRFILPEDQGIYCRYRKGLSAAGAPQVCEIRMLRADAPPFWARLEAGAVRAADASPICRVVMSDVTERKRGEERARTYLNLVETIIVAVDADGKVSLINRAGCRLLGWREEEIIGKVWFDHFLPERLRGSVKNVFGRLLSGDAGSPACHENPILTKGGEERLILWRNIILRDESGRATGTLSSGEDITERKQGESSLKDSEERFRRLFETSRDALMTLAPPSWAFTSGNPATIAMFRAKDAADFTSRGPWELSPERQPDGRASSDKAREMIGTAMREGSNFFEWTHMRLDGEEFPADVLLTRLETSGKTFLQATVRDLTERRRAEGVLRDAMEQAQDAANKTEAIIAAIGDGMSIQGRDFRVLFQNAAHEKSMGEHAGELCYEAYEHRSVVCEGCPIALSFADGGVHATERIVEDEKGRRHFELIASPLRNAAGEIVAGIEMVRDITERKWAAGENEKLQAQLRQAQRMEVVGRLAGGVAHDFNNLLTAILGNCTFLLADIPKDDPRRADVEEIRKAGERAANLTRQLLAFSRKQVLQPRILDMNSVLTDMEKLLRRLIGEDIEMRISRAEGLALVKADPGQMEQIVMNLAVNARDAMRKGGRLSIETGNLDLPEPRALAHDAQVPPGRYVLMTVSDTGSGMDAATLEHAFEPFFTTKETGKGTGLGLSTVYGIVKQSGGFINVQSEPGKGAAFSIFLPAVSGAGREGRREEEGEGAGKQKKWGQKSPGTILVVEDDEVVRRIALRILAEAGYIVIEAKSGQEALTHLDEHFDLVLTDIVLPDIPGVEVAARLKGAQPALRVVFTSGYADNPDIREILSRPENRFLQKPFTAQVLRDMVREALA